MQHFRQLVNRFVTPDPDWRKQHGYIAHPTSEQASVSLVQANQMVLAWDQDILAGFYLVDHWRHIYGQERFKYLDAIFAKACESEGLDPSRTACGAQTVVDLPYQGSGLRVLMLKALLIRLSAKYSHLFSMIGKDNGRATTAHTRDGWRVVAEDEDFTYVVLDVPAEIRRMGD